MNNYYTPDVSDIFVGYECELEGCGWRSISISKHYMSRALQKLKNGLLRTPYLTKEQIIAEGWEDVTPELNIGIWHFENGHRIVRYNFIDKIAWIMNVDFSRETTRPMGFPDDGDFRGKCPSINEFRKICKLLSI